MGPRRPRATALKGMRMNRTEGQVEPLVDQGRDNVLIHLEGVSKVFYTDEVETHALDDVHLEISKGEYVSIEGPSGSGKTTLLSILGLLDTPSKGSYTLHKDAVATLSARQRALLRNR